MNPSPYASLYAGYAAANARLWAYERHPDVVATVVLDALAARQPRTRYGVGVPLATRVLIALPDAVRDAMMRRLYQSGTRAGRGRR